MALLEVASDRSAIRVGRLIVARARQPEGAPRLDGGTTTVRDGEGRADHYGALVLRLRGTRAVAVGWRGARVPNPARWLRGPS